MVSSIDFRLLLKHLDYFLNLAHFSCVVLQIAELSGGFVSDDEAAAALQRRINILIYKV